MKNICFYFIRGDSKFRPPIVTICLAESDVPGYFIRGVAICSVSDNPVKKKGKEEAFRNAEMIENELISFGDNREKEGMRSGRIFLSGYVSAAAKKYGIPIHKIPRYKRYAISDGSLSPTEKLTLGCHIAAVEKRKEDRDSKMKEN